jgi:hypothetical protein
MSKTARSARGDVVDFDLLAIKQQLALKPVPVSVNARRKFIDERDGLKSRRIEAEQQVAIDMDGPLAMAAIAAQESAEASE